MSYRRTFGPALLSNGDGDILIMDNVAGLPGTGHLYHIGPGRSADLRKAVAGGDGHGSEGEEHDGHCGEDYGVALA